MTSATEKLRREGGGAMSELKPCPLCGEKATLIKDGLAEGFYVVECSNCTARGPMTGRPEAIKLWNTRTERTCHMTYNEECSGDELYPTEVYECECGGFSVDGVPNYCPSCGAKVILD